VSSELANADIDLLLQNIDAFDAAEQEEILEIAEVLAERKKAEAGRNDLIEFCRAMQPDYKVGKHHRILANLLMDIAEGKKDRICVNMPPRHGKSQLVSIYFPAWFIGRYPNKKVLMVSHTTDLAVDFGRKVRNLIASDSYRKVFPTVSLAADSKSAGRWNTYAGGEYFACLRRYALVHTTKGVIPAARVQVGDTLLNAGKPVTVLKIYNSQHDSTYQIHKLDCSAEHPIWTMQRGWVYASDVQPCDILCTESISDKVGKLWGADRQQHDPVEYGKKTQEELRAYGNPEGLGWLRCFGTRVLSLCSKNSEPNQLPSGIKKYLAGVRGAAQNVFGLLLGVRHAGVIKKTVHTTPKHFVNFLTDGDHTFFANKILTHNCGVGSALAGRGADLLLVDDPHNEQDIINGNFDVFDKAYEWFTYGARTRLMPGGRVAIVQTRWHLDDLTGRVLKDMNNENADQYNVVEFPAILEVKDKETGQIGEKALWPEFFDLTALYRTKASMPVFQWNAQYQQNPTAEEAALVKREWWKIWEKDTPPNCEYIIMSLDAAAESHNRADFTALTTWGVFLNEEVDAYHIILLNSIKKRVEFPELKTLALEEWKEWEPDSFIVEKKSAGTQLYQELRRIGIPVQEYTPHRGTGDKMARLNSVADIVRSGLCWVPEARWAEEVVEEIAGFPFVSHDDLVDSTVMALMRFRNGGFIRLPSDEPEDIKYFKNRKRGGYY